MKWTDQSEGVLLQRSFLFGITGSILGTLSILNSNYQVIQAPMGPLNGICILLLLVGLSIAVLVLRKKKMIPENKQKAQKMVLVLGVALLFFILTV
jgi:uncharacterized YccA/Bax inhibitor family protein